MTPPTPDPLTYLRVVTTTYLILGPLLILAGILIVRSILSSLDLNGTTTRDFRNFLCLMAGLLLAVFGLVAFLGNIEPAIKVWFFPGMPCPQ